MKQDIQKIFNEAIHLPPVERAELLERIIESFDAEPDEEIQKAWAEEAERRLAIHNAGDGVTLSEDEVFARIQKDNTK